MGTKKTFRYQAFGLNIDSEFELFQLAKGKVSATTDLKIIKGHVAKEGASANKLKDNDNVFQLSIPEVGRFLIRNGNEVIVDMADEVDLQTMKLYLLGSCLGAILQQRGDLVLHGNAARFGNKAVIVVAPSGVGKSTLAAEFLRRGYQLLADDVCAIDDKGYVQPSYPYLKLWQNSLDKLDFKQDELIKIRLQKEKFYYPLKDSFCQEALPVAAIYVLNKGEEDKLKLTKLNGIEKLKVLRRNTYRPGYARKMKIIHTHLSRFAEMLKNVSVKRIIRPDNSFQLEELAQLIIDDIEDNNIINQSHKNHKK